MLWRSKINLEATQSNMRQVTHITQCQHPHPPETHTTQQNTHTHTQKARKGTMPWYCLDSIKLKKTAKKSRGGVAKRSEGGDDCE